MDYEAVIGLETHVQLKTRSKTRCIASRAWGEEPVKARVKTTRTLLVMFRPLAGEPASRNNHAVLSCFRRWVAVLGVVSTLRTFAQEIAYVDLHPSGLTVSGVLATSGSQQVGYACVGGLYYHAGLWSAAASFVDLNPAGTTFSRACATSGSQQAGYVEIGGYHHAGIWSGTAGSFVDLNPAGSSSSYAYALSGNQQAGSANSHAGIWSGTASSFVDLNPVGYYSSCAYATTGSQQAGCAVVNAHAHAGIWSGTASSFVDLHPSFASDSYALAASGNQQAGYVEFNFWGYTSHASIWSGTASSFEDLNPLGANYSVACATTGSHQAGYASFGGYSSGWGGDLTGDVVHAGVWSGTADSFVDLGAILGPDYWNSYARSILDNGTELLVAGEAYNIYSGTHAILWIIPVPEPSSTGFMLLGLSGLGLRRMLRVSCG